MDQAYKWERHPHAEALIESILDDCCESNPFISGFQQDLLKHTSTRLFDWLDHVIINHSPGIEKELIDTGFIAGLATPGYRIFYHPGAQLPRVVVHDHEQVPSGLAVKVDYIADFLLVHGLSAKIEGTPFSPYRRCFISTENNASLWVVERRGTHNLEPTYTQTKYIEAQEKWQSRPRILTDEDELMQKTIDLAEELVSMLGIDLAAWVVLESERKYWQARNTAAQIQKNRQDRMGMGWANHDHHTFRSSRHHFHQLVRMFEILGFTCRERFYAGEEAGWGAQVMENSRCGLVLFLDVDLAPDELQIDFAHHPLKELKHLGTIGLWCGLHGDSILKAGMHHLEAQFMFDDLKNDLQHLGVGMMDPFSNFDYLKQAFTHGEIWPVDPLKVAELVEKGYLKHQEAEKFLTYGAVGSHLENLQRRDGYKGFNQKNVSTIIKKTDPRWA